MSHKPECECVYADPPCQPPCKHCRCASIQRTERRVRADAAAAIQRVRELHEEYKGTCPECSDPEDGITVFFPCDTIRALDGSHE